MLPAQQAPLHVVGREYADISDFKMRYGEALVRQKCGRLLPLTSPLVVRASFPPVARLSGTANTQSSRSVHYVIKLLFFYRIFAR